MGSFTLTLVPLAALCAIATSQYYQQTTPVPILKQINRHNEDGSYSYGYEGADGSFKIETKHTTGEVFGKYGYVDDAGKVREVEYGASRRGFEPTGSGINVPPPTLNGNSVANDDSDDGQYREDPSMYYKNERYNSAPRYNSNPAPYRPPKQQQYNQHQQQQYNPPPQQSYYTPPQQSYYTPPQPSYNSQPAYRPPTPIDPSIFAGHPAQNFDVNSGSYSLSYSG